MLPFDRGLVGELKVTQEDVKRTVGFGRYWPRQAHGLSTGAWTYDGLWMPPNAPSQARTYPWGDKGKSTLVLGFDENTWTTTQADILKPPPPEEFRGARPPPANAGSSRKGATFLDQSSPYSALTGYRKPEIASTERLEIPGKRTMAGRSIADEISEANDHAWLASKPDPRASISTPMSEVRERFCDPAETERGGPDPNAQARFLDAVGVFKSTGSIGPPEW